MQYLYADGELFNFMNQETYDQVALNKDIIGDALKFVKENEVCKVVSYNGNVFSVEPPLFVELEITETEIRHRAPASLQPWKPVQPYTYLYSWRLATRLRLIPGPASIFHVYNGL